MAVGAVDLVSSLGRLGVFVTTREAEALIGRWTKSKVPKGNSAKSGSLSFRVWRKIWCVTPRPLRVPRYLLGACTVLTPLRSIAPVSSPPPLRNDDTNQAQSHSGRRREMASFASRLVGSRRPSGRSVRNRAKLRGRCDRDGRRLARPRCKPHGEAELQEAHAPPLEVRARHGSRAGRGVWYCRPLWQPGAHSPARLYIEMRHSVRGLARSRATTLQCMLEYYCIRAGGSVVM